MGDTVTCHVPYDVLRPGVAHTGRCVCAKHNHRITRGNSSMNARIATRWGIAGGNGNHVSAHGCAALLRGNGMTSPVVSLPVMTAPARSVAARKGSSVRCA